MVAEKKETEMIAPGIPTLSLSKTKSIGNFITESTELSSSGLSMKECIKGINYLLDKPLKKIQPEEADRQK